MSPRWPAQACPSDEKRARDDGRRRGSTAPTLMLRRTRRSTPAWRTRPAYTNVLGGKDNYAADRAAVEAGLQVWPYMAFAMRANRAFLGRGCSLSRRGSGDAPVPGHRHRHPDGGQHPRDRPGHRAPVAGGVRGQTSLRTEDQPWTYVTVPPPTLLGARKPEAIAHSRVAWRRYSPDRGVRARAIPGRNDEYGPFRLRCAWPIMGVRISEDRPPPEAYCACPLSVILATKQLRGFVT